MSGLTPEQAATALDLAARLGLGPDQITDHCTLADSSMSGIRPVTLNGTLTITIDLDGVITADVHAAEIPAGVVVLLYDSLRPGPEGFRSRRPNSEGPQ